MTKNKNKFRLKIYDNYHYMDESEAYETGWFATYDEALIEAKIIVDEFLESCWKFGATPSFLLQQFSMFGEDPVIIPNEPGEHESFSAFNYASTRVVEICQKHEEKYLLTQQLYQEAIKFATAKHMINQQKVPGTDFPYVVHLSNVAMEIIIASSYSDNFNLAFAVQIALLHDTLEDTPTKIKELENKFGLDVAKAVSALTKNSALPKEKQMKYSLRRIKKLQPEVGAVKLADRITNLQSPPPHWDNEKKINYQKEAIIILEELKDSNKYLAKRLGAKIEEYSNYIHK